MQRADTGHLPVFHQSNNVTYDITQIKLPTAYNFLPHLLDDSKSLLPAFVHSKGIKTNANIVLGIPTVKRAVQNYLMMTIKSLLNGMNPVETADTLIVVFVAEVCISSRVLRFVDEEG